MSTVASQRRTDRHRPAREHDRQRQRDAHREGNVLLQNFLPKSGEYSLIKLKGKFARPGTTSAEVAGTAKRVKSGSEHGCKGPLHLTGEEASLEDQETGQPFEAEI